MPKPRQEKPLLDSDRQLLLGSAIASVLFHGIVFAVVAGMEMPAPPNREKTEKSLPAIAVKIIEPTPTSTATESQQNASTQPTQPTNSPSPSPATNSQPQASPPPTTQPAKQPTPLPTPTPTPSPRAKANPQSPTSPTRNSAQESPQPSPTNSPSQPQPETSPKPPKTTPSPTIPSSEQRRQEKVERLLQDIRNSQQENAQKPSDNGSEGENRENSASPSPATGESTEETTTAQRNDIRETNQSAPASPPTPKPSPSPSPQPQPRQSQVNCVRCPQPAYPKAAVEEQIEGSTRLLLDIDPNGNVTNVRVSRSSGSSLLDHAAMEAAWGYQFSASEYGYRGRGVTIHFQLRR